MFSEGVILTNLKHSEKFNEEWPQTRSIIQLSPLNSIYLLDRGESNIRFVGQIEADTGRSTKRSWVQRQFQSPRQIECQTQPCATKVFLAKNIHKYAFSEIRLETRIKFISLVTFKTKKDSIPYSGIFWLNTRVSLSATVSHHIIYIIQLSFGVETLVVPFVSLKGNIIRKSLFGLNNLGVQISNIFKWIAC